MPFVLLLVHRLAQQGWKVKIRDRERLEPPHVTILFKTKAWRINLRTRKFLDKDPPPSEVPSEILSAIDESWSTLQDEWNKMYPENPMMESDHE